MREVADRAGVSISTVSHVVNRTRRVAPETREAVLAAMNELGFAERDRSDTAHGKSTLGVVMSGISNPYLGELVQGIEQEATRAGLAMFLCDSHEDPRREAEAIQGLIAHNVEAIVLTPTAGWENHTLPLLRKYQRPYVLADRLSSVRCDQVGSENESASATLTEHLLDLGHRRIAMVAGLDGLSTTTERVHGYQRALKDAGIPYAPELLITGGSTVAGGRHSVLSLLKLPDPPTALFIGNNAMTVGALDALKRAGKQIPRDVALVAFDDFEWAEVMSPPLTTVTQAFHAVGAQAVQLLLRRLKDPMAPRRVVRLPVGIEHRNSCGCGLPAVAREAV